MDDLPTRLEVRAGRLPYRYELHARLGRVRYGERYRASDVTSQLLPEPGQPSPAEVSLEVIRPADAGHRFRLEEAFEAFHSRRAPEFLELLTLGEAPDGLVVLVTESWDRSLADALRQQGALTDAELEQLFWAVSGGLFALHEAGYAHGDLTLDSVVATAGGWKLTPGHPPRGASSDHAADILAAGRLFRQALGLPPDDHRPVPPPAPAPAPPPPPPPPVMRAVAGWLGRVRGVPLAWGDRLKEYATPTRVAPDLPPPTPHHDAPPAWRAVLQGCLEPDPARRWTATRLIFGAQPPPVVDEFWLVPSGNGSLRLSWQAPAEGRVVVHDLEGRPAAGHGAVCGMAALPSLAPALRVPEGANETIVDVPAETRHLQAVTVMEPRRAVAFGAVIGLSRVPDVFAVRALPSGGRLQLTWRWPEGVDLAYVAVRDDRFAGAADEGPRLGCLRSDYEARGCFYVSAPAGARAGLFISVFAARRAAGALVYAPGATPGARARIEHAQVTLRYFVQPAGAGEYDLLLEPGAAAELPGLLLVGATDRLPLHRNDGTLLCPVEPGAHCTPGRPLARRFRTPRPGPYRARLFCQRDEDYRWLQLESVPAAGVIVA